MTRKKIDISQKTVTMYGSGKLGINVSQAGSGKRR